MPWGDAVRKNAGLFFIAYTKVRVLHVGSSFGWAGHRTMTDEYWCGLCLMRLQDAHRLDAMCASMVGQGTFATPPGPSTNLRSVSRRR